MRSIDECNIGEIYIKSRMEASTDVIKEGDIPDVNSMLDIPLSKVMAALERDDNRRDLYLELEAWVNDNCDQFIDDIDMTDTTNRANTYGTGETNYEG